jgi:hypothetical protein
MHSRKIEGFDKAFQFEFMCDRRGNGFMTELQSSMTGMAGSVGRYAARLPRHISAF